MLLCVIADYDYEYPHKGLLFTRWESDRHSAYPYHTSVIVDEEDAESTKAAMREQIIESIEKKRGKDYRNLDIIFKVEEVAKDWSVRCAIRNLSGEQFKKYLQECGIDEIQVRM